MLTSLKVLMAAGAALSLSACASEPQKFEAELLQPATAPIGVIQVAVADGIVKSQSGSTRITGDDSIGPNDANEVKELLYAELERALVASGDFRPMVGQEIATLKATITRVAPNRLDFTDRGKSAGGPRGYARGGATVEAVLIAPDGSEIARFSYDRYAMTIEDAAIRGETWGDAKRTFGIFADEIAEELHAG